MRPLSPLHAAASQLAELAITEPHRRGARLSPGERASLLPRQDATLLAALPPGVRAIYDAPLRELPEPWPVEELRASLPELPAGASVFLSRTVQVPSEPHGLISAAALSMEGRAVAAVSLLLPSRYMMTACTDAAGLALIGAQGRFQPYDRRLRQRDLPETVGQVEAPVLLALARVVLLSRQKDRLLITPGRERAAALVLSVFAQGLGLGLAHESGGPLDLSAGDRPVPGLLGDSPLRVTSLAAAAAPYRPPLPPPEPAPEPAPEPQKPSYEPPEPLRSFFEAQHKASYGEGDEEVEYAFNESNLVEDEELDSLPKPVRAFYEDCLEVASEGDGFYPGLYRMNVGGMKTFAMLASGDGDETLLAVFDSRGRSLARAWTHGSEMSWEEPELPLDALLTRAFGGEQQQEL